MVQGKRYSSGRARFLRHGLHLFAEKDRIVEELNQSLDFASKTINGMSNADFAKLLPKLGPQANEGDVVYILVADAHEHLGQLIAYARQNGIVPPWTVEAEKKKAAAAAGK